MILAYSVQFQHKGNSKYSVIKAHFKILNPENIFQQQNLNWNICMLMQALIKQYVISLQNISTCSTAAFILMYNSLDTFFMDFTEQPWEKEALKKKTEQKKGSVFFQTLSIYMVL